MTLAFKHAVAGVSNFCFRRFPSPSFLGMAAFSVEQELLRQQARAAGTAEPYPLDAPETHDPACRRSRSRSPVPGGHAGETGAVPAPSTPDEAATRTQMLEHRVGRLDDALRGAEAFWRNRHQLLEGRLLQQAAQIRLLHTYVHTYIRTYIHMHIRTYIHSFIHTYIHIHIYIYMASYEYIASSALASGNTQRGCSTVLQGFGF